MVPGVASRTTYGATNAKPSNLGVMLMSPSGRPGSDVSEYARHDACRRPGSRREGTAWPVALPLPARLDEDGDGIRRLALDPLDPAP